jgi:2-polyprenyl-3-methyl-5-hydroxy-6-metoxy-1,4-benzoquinol methylase
MTFGTETAYLYRNPLKRAVVRIIGDTHYGHVLRYLYLKQTLDALKIRPRRILDAGCGRGELTLYLARRFPDAEIVGVDADARELELAKQMQRAAGIENVAFHECDLQGSLPFGQFDLILSFEVIECVPDDNAMLKNLNAALQAKGICLIHVMHKTGAYRRVGLRRLHAPALGDWSSTGQVRAGYTEPELSELLRRNGFAQVTTRLTFGAWGMWAHSVFEFARTLPMPFYLCVYPFLVAAGHVDTHLQHAWGGSVLAIAAKTL